MFIAKPDRKKSAVHSIPRWCLQWIQLVEEMKDYVTLVTARAPQIAIIVSLVVAVKASAQSFQVVDLGTLGGRSSTANAVNNAGVVVGNSDTANGGLHGTVFANGTATDTGTVGQLAGSGYDWSLATGINDSGVVVGASLNSYFTWTTFRYSNGTLQDMGAMGGWLSLGTAINSSGQIAGYYATNSGAGHAYLYTAGTVTDIGAQLPGVSEANAINDSGQVTGRFIVNGVDRAFLYQSGGVTVLGTLGGANSQGLAINSAGTVVGKSTTSSGATHAFKYSAGSMMDLGSLGGDSRAQGINAAGVIVGVSYDNNGVERAFIFRDGQMTDLNLEVSLAGTDLTILNGANAINELGQIAGYGTTTSGATHAFLAIPILEPVEAPGIVTQPVSQQTISQGGAVTFTVVASGTPAPTFQWQKDGIDIPGATSATFTVTRVSAADEGTYRVVVTNSAGSAISNGTVLTVHVPVIFIPGIAGSELYLPQAPAPEARVWPEQAVSGAARWFGEAIDKLQFTEDGLPLYDNDNPVYARSLFEGIPWPDQRVHTVYKWRIGIVRALQESGREVVLCPYDFRFSPEDGALILKESINQICQAAGDKVDVVAHSMGGLVAQAYIRHAQLSSVEHHIRRLVTMGTPFLGAPRALQLLRAGWDLDVRVVNSDTFGVHWIRVMDPGRVKRMAHNWPGLYALLPGIRLQDQIGPAWTYTSAPNAIRTPIDPALLQSSLAQIPEPLNDDFCPLLDTDPPPRRSLSSTILNEAFGYFNLRDSPGLLGVRTLTIIGELLDRNNLPQATTPICFNEFANLESVANDYAGFVISNIPSWSQDLTLGEGDGTVPTQSATGLGVHPQVMVSSNHMDLVSDDTACNFATNFVNTGTVAAIPPVPMSIGHLYIIAHSPVILDAVDSTGRHTTIGPDSITRDNLDVWAEHFGEAKALVLSSNLAAQVSISGVANGLVTVEVRNTTADGSTISMRKWLEFPVTPSSSGNLQITPGKNPELKWDYNGDGKYDYVGGPDSDGDGVPDDKDLYPNTPLDAVVNGDGGCLAQVVPLMANWKNQGEYISTFTHEARKFVDAGLITSQQAAQAIKLATQLYPSGGKPTPQTPQLGQWDHRRRYWAPVGALGK